MKKIHIIGISGSGKTYLSKKISNKLDIPSFDLDEIRWIEKYSQLRTDEEEMKKLLKDSISDLDKWVTEGIYYKWIGFLLENSDTIIWIQLDNRIKLVWRIILRSIQNTSEKESLKSTWNLIRFQWQYKKIRKGKKESLFQSHKKLTLP